MELLLHTTLFSKLSLSCPSLYPNTLAFNGSSVTRRRFFSKNPKSFLTPLRISLSSEHDLKPNDQHRGDGEILSGGESNSNCIEVIGIGSRKDAVLDFCVESPLQSPTSLRFWNIQSTDSGEVQLLQKSRAQDVVLRSLEGPVSQLSSSRAVVLVASAGYGLDHIKAIELLGERKSADGFSVGIIMKPFSFEGRRRQDEVNDLVNKLWENTNFCIEVDTDALLKREMVTLAEALKSANNAVLLALNAISILMSDLHKKFLDQPNSKIKELKDLEIVKLLSSCGKAKVGFGVGKSAKSSIARAVFDCPFLGDGMQENEMVVCTVASCDVKEHNDIHEFLQAFRQTTGFKKDIVLSVFCEPNLEKNLVVTTVIALGCNEQGTSQKQGFLSRLALRFPFMFSLLGRSHPDTEIAAVNSNSKDTYSSGVISSSDSMDMQNLDSSDGVDENLDSDFDELRTLSEEPNGLREFDGEDKISGGRTSQGNSNLHSHVSDQSAEEQPVFREPLIRRNVGPAFDVEQVRAQKRAASGSDPVFGRQIFFSLPVGVKKSSSQDWQQFPKSQQLSDPRVLDDISGVSQGTTDLLSWDALTDASREAVKDVYGAASTLLKGNTADIPRKQGALSARAASMLESERDSEKKWSRTTEMQYRGGIYKGRCQGGLPEGKGRLTLPDGCIYDGMWRYGKRSGLGAFYYSNGDVYQGSWRDDLMHGRGWFYFRTGDRWFVNFWKGKANGEGRFYSKGGEIFFGSFQDGWRHGESLFIDAEGRRWTEIWDDGVLLSREPLDSETTSN
ncbi:hypothetical protein MKW94_001554 [Papaver nudicaule]|uniref:Protein ACCUMULATION AND REPLICATION OF CHLOROPLASTS 3 n=1 Tax=Papaver nudicaule TaxID=74823 RepID=A0AA41VYJ6_PAPNU|nr:hypothetical protein [Papaver nudicaule]